MILGKTSEFVESEFHEKYHKYEVCPFEYLLSYGCHTKLHTVKDVELVPGNIYLLSVPSLNMIATFHNIVVDFRGDKLEVYDPNEGREGRKVYVCKPEDELAPHEVNIRAWNIDASITHAPWFDIALDP